MRWASAGYTMWLRIFWGCCGAYWLADPQEDMVIVMMIQQMGRQLKLREDFNSLVDQAIDD